MDQAYHGKKYDSINDICNDLAKYSKIGKDQKESENGITQKMLLNAGIFNKDNNTIIGNKDNNVQYNSNIQEKFNNTKIINKSKLNIDNYNCINKFHPKMGIKNLNNNDYMNSILQCLINNKKINDFFSSKNKILENKVDICPVSYFISKTIIILNQSYNDNKKNNGSYSISPLIKLLSYLNPSFEKVSSKNPIDFLIFLFFRLSEESKNLDKVGKNDIISDLFSWVSKKEIQCKDCGNKSTIIQNFYTFDLDYKNINNNGNISINDCLNNYSKKKELYNIYCCKCRRKVMSSNNVYLIDKLPKIFIFVVKDSVNEKEKITIKFEKNMFIKDNKYELKNIVAFDKKYIAYCKSFNDGMWYEYKDEDVNQINFEEIIGIDQKKIRPMILFYESLS